MNLHGLVAPYIGAVNPLLPVAIQISAGSLTAADGSRTPRYQTPGQFTGSIAGNVLTVTAIETGLLAIGQTVAGDDMLPTVILALGTGVGELGTYVLDAEQDIASQIMTTTLGATAQIQPMSYKDIQQTEGLNLNGTRRSIYINGALNGLVRPQFKGGDIVTFPRTGEIWLIAMVLEQWPDWVKVAATLQNLSFAADGGSPSSQFLPGGIP